MAYAFEVKLKAMQVREAKGPMVKGATDIVAAFADIATMDREAFYVVTLTQKHKVIDRHLISLGTLNASLVHPREVFKPVILDSAAAIIFCHNHPSGDCTPSPEDKNLTARLKSAAEIFGIAVLDHVIVGGTSHFSFAESGLL